MDKTNVCLGCRFGSVKIDILVPEKYNLKEFVKQTQNFASGVTAVTREKPIHYALTFENHGGDSEKLNFEIHCSCILNVKTRDCSKFNPAKKECRVEHLAQAQPIPINP